jgi:hypothetical protein
MKMIPHDQKGWLRVLLLPFKAYVIIAPVLLMISEKFPRAPHSGATDAEIRLVILLMPCAVLLLIASLLLALAGPKGSAFPCFGLGVAAIVLLVYFLPALANT